MTRGKVIAAAVMLSLMMCGSPVSAMAETLPDEEEKVQTSSEENTKNNSENGEEIIAEATSKKEIIKKIAGGITDSETAKTAGYESKSVSSLDDLGTGDVMIDDKERVYAYESAADSDSGAARWYEIKDGELEEAGVNFDNSNDFFGYKKQIPLVPNVDAISVPYGTMLYDIKLPNGFTWIDADSLLKTMGEEEFKVAYTPENNIEYTSGIGTVKVTVTKLSKDISEVPDDEYEISYYEGNKLSAISLPDGWEWETPDTLLEVGKNEYKARYKTSDNYTYNDNEKSVTVRVKRSTFNVKAINITVTEGTKLDDSLLPVLSEGVLKWTEKDQTVNSSCVKTCYFVPNDKEHYTGTTDINVTVRVVKKSSDINKTESEKNTDKIVETPESGNKTSADNLNVTSKSSKDNTSASGKVSADTSKSSGSATSANGNSAVSSADKTNASQAAGSKGTQSAGNTSSNTSASSVSNGVTSKKSSTETNSTGAGTEDATSKSVTTASAARKSSTLPEINLITDETGASQSAGNNAKPSSSLNKLDLSDAASNTGASEQNANSGKKNNMSDAGSMQTDKADKTEKAEAPAGVDSTTEEKENKEEDTESKKDTSTGTDAKDNSGKKDEKKKNSTKKYTLVAVLAAGVVAAAYFALNRLKASRLRR